MKTKYRLYGMIICLVIVMLSAVIGSYYPDLQGSSLMLMMFAAGYALRETLEVNKDEE